MTNFAAIKVIKTIYCTFPFMTPRTKPSTSPRGQGQGLRPRPRP